MVTRLLSVTRVTTEATSWRKFSELVSYHVLCDVNRDEFISVMNCNSVSHQIKAEVESLYKVNVVDVNTLLYAGKRQARYTKAGLVKGQKTSFKKAIVTLKEGESIDFYSNIE